MNGRKAKQLRKKGKAILVDWLHSILPTEEDKEQITIDTLDDFLAEQTHIYANRKFLLSAYSLKWIYKRVKRNPELTLDQLQRDIKNEQKTTRSFVGGGYHL